MSGSRGLADELRERLRGRIVLVGIGNPLRGDDAAGCLVARALAGVPGLTVVDGDDTPEREVPRIAALSPPPDTVVLVDAVELGAAPGSVALLAPADLARYTPTTHRVPLALLGDIIHAACGARVVVLAIQPSRIELGTGLSRAAERGVGVLVDTVREVLGAPAAASLAGAASC